VPIEPFSMVMIGVDMDDKDGSAATNSGWRRGEAVLLFSIPHPTQALYRNVSKHSNPEFKEQLVPHA